jgi:hypothetical protein
VTAPHEPFANFRILQQRLSDHVARALDVVRFQEPQYTPDTGPGAILHVSLEHYNATYLVKRLDVDIPGPF